MAGRGVQVDLNRLLAKAAATRCHVFLAQVLDGTGPRMAAEQDMARRGWVEANSPAEADILCVCGVVPEDQGDALERLWDQLPGPRARTQITRPEDASTALDGSVAELMDMDALREREAARPTDPDQGGDMHDGGMEHGGMEHGDDGPDMEGMDHGGMDMPMPGGIALAGEGTDRDGLNLDVLKVPLGPYLPLWPAGMVLHCELQGDVVFAATVEYAFGQARAHAMDTPDADDRSTLVHYTDLASRLLRLAGATGSAVRVRAIRDAALDGTPQDASLSGCRRDLEAELSRLRRNWLLRRTLRGIGSIPAGSGRPVLDGTDVWARLLGMIEAAAAGAPAAEPEARDAAAALPGLVRGQELAVVRLIVASLDLAPATAHAEFSR